MEKLTLRADEFYGVKQIGSGRKDKICSHCGKVIKIGTTHDMNTFFPDPNFIPDPNIPPKDDPKTMYRNFPTHKECTAPFHSTFIE